MVLFAFGVGFANFASGRHLSPRNVVDAISEELPLVASYGSTGNVAVEDGNVDEIRRVLERVRLFEVSAARTTTQRRSGRPTLCYS